MLFTSPTFIFVFLPLVLFLYYVCLKWTRSGQNVLLMLCSLFFYAWGEPVFVLIMLVSILLNWFFAVVIDLISQRIILSRVVIGLMVACNLSILCYYKYLAFFVININDLFGFSYGVPQVVLPLGISFFTFQAISYVIDVYRNEGAVQRNPFNVALYIALFPQLIAGPIVRYKTISEQILYRKENWSDFSDGVERFILGLSKKLLIANNVAIIADEAFFYSGDASVLMLWMGAIAYSLQIYFDFSAYSDMAIGLGRMFGFKFLENFNYPYVSRSITEFWRRWHISLGSWFRDYVYIPLGGNRVSSTWHLVFNLFVVWLLTGIWHGANWTFVAWGGMYFVLLVGEKLWQIEKKLSFFSTIYTLLFVVLGWVVFRSPDISSAVAYIASMFGAGDRCLVDEYTVFYLREYAGYLLIAIVFSLPVYPTLEKIGGKVALYLPIKFIVVSVLFLVTLSYIIRGGYNPFIYSNF